MNRWIILPTILLVASIAYHVLYRIRLHSRLLGLVDSLERINRGIYDIDWDSMSEGEIHILKNELYKTTLMLREQAQKERRDKENVKEALSDISHQIKTPLTEIQLQAEALLSGLSSYTESGNADSAEHTNSVCGISAGEKDAEPSAAIGATEIKAGERLRKIRRSCAAINTLVQEILTLSRLEANAVTLHDADCRLFQLATQAAEAVEALADLLDVTIAVTGDAPVLCLDAHWQTEAIANLLKNCLEHSAPGSRIELTIAPSPLYQELRIRDYGTGIPAEELPHIFDRYYRGTNASPSGAGIGLALAKAIIEKERGTLFAETPEDGGTLFVVRYYE